MTMGVVDESTGSRNSRKLNILFFLVDGNAPPFVIAQQISMRPESEMEVNIKRKYQETRLSSPCSMPYVLPFQATCVIS